MTSSNMTLNMTDLLALKFYQDLSIVPPGGREERVLDTVTDFLIHKIYYVESPKKMKKKDTGEVDLPPFHSTVSLKQNKTNKGGSRSLIFLY